ncbi:MAG: GNAT family N-acetyltransferase [Clostridia bacterium]
MEIRLLENHERGDGLELAWEVFLKYDAPGYSREGIDAFGYAIHDPGYVRGLKFYGAFDSGEMRGVLATREQGNHIALFFVDGAHHRRGIGKALAEQAKKDCGSGELTVHSSPYAVEIYRRLGFELLGEKEEKDGIAYIPMKWKRK